MAKKRKKKVAKARKAFTLFTLKKREFFLEHLRTSANVTLSALSADITPRTAYHHKEKNAAFSEEWDEAIEEAVDLLEAEARRRGFQGIEKPIYYQGRRVDTVREYSDVLLIFLLKAHRPHKYRERHEFTGAGGGPIEYKEIRRVIVD